LGLGQLPQTWNSSSSLVIPPSPAVEGSGMAPLPPPLSREDSNISDVFEEAAHPLRMRTISFRSDEGPNGGAAAAGTGTPNSLTGSWRQVSSSRPGSGMVKSILIPARELRPLQDPMAELLQPLHKLMFVCRQPASGKASAARHVLTVFQRHLFAQDTRRLKSQLQLLAAAQDVPVGLDFGPAAYMLQQELSGTSAGASTALGQGGSGSGPRESEDALAEDPLLVNRHGLSYQQLRQAMERECLRLGYYAITEERGNASVS
jgi:hypothetical protein